MTPDFIKFPSTPHLTNLGMIDIRNDKVMSATERDDLLHHDIIVEEKVDGANLGLSFDGEGNLQAQNRGAYLFFPSPDQWKKLPEWLAPRANTLFDKLTDRFILFGEWCYAVHSILYDRLPDWFLGFDIYDKQVNRFLSADRRDHIFEAIGICKVPTIGRGKFSLSDLKRLFSQSQLSTRAAEGIYLRYDRGGFLSKRAKLVRPEFIQSLDEHWTHSGIQPNRLKPEVHFADHGFNSL